VLGLSIVGHSKRYRVGRLWQLYQRSDTIEFHAFAPKPTLDLLEPIPGLINSDSHRFHRPMLAREIIPRHKQRLHAGRNCRRGRALPPWEYVSREIPPKQIGPLLSQYPPVLAKSEEIGTGPGEEIHESALMIEFQGTLRSLEAELSADNNDAGN
jgi:hypothetical protein